MPSEFWVALYQATMSSILLTFRAVARASQAVFRDVDARTGGQVSRAGGVTRFTEIVVDDPIG